MELSSACSISAMLKGKLSILQPFLTMGSHFKSIFVKISHSSISSSAKIVGFRDRAPFLWWSNIC